MFSFLNSSKLIVKRMGLLVLASSLLACQSTPEPEAKVAATPVAEAPKELTQEQKHINAILAEADYALSQNRLLNPVTDNAHDRYRSVLLMDPQNEHAKRGLEVIAMRYLDLARSAAAKGNLAEAQTMMTYARQIDNNPAVQDATETLRKQIASAPAVKPYQAGANEVLLDPKLLQAKDPKVVAQLVGVAQRAKQNDELVLIIARSDTEGRWVYQQLRSAVPGFLVRGDIRVGQPSRVKLVKSLD